MIRAAVVCLAFSWATTANALCDELAVADAHVLTKAQLGKRICADNARHDEAKGKATIVDSRISTRCLFAAAHNEQLYRERFSKPSGCMKLDGDK